MAYAFISYQTNERHVAARVHNALASVDIQSFMAHEHIQVSEEWRLRILQEISVCDIFLCILSQAYLASPWCVQESGISAVRGGMTIIPLSIDGTIPPGFIGNIQSTRVDPNTLWLNDLIPGLAKHDFNFTFGLMLNTLLWHALDPSVVRRKTLGPFFLTSIDCPLNRPRNSLWYLLETATSCTPICVPHKWACKTANTAVNTDAPPKSQRSAGYLGRFRRFLCLQETVHKFCAPSCGWNRQPAEKIGKIPGHQKHPDPLEDQTEPASTSYQPTRSNLRLSLCDNRSQTTVFENLSTIVTVTP